jgi:hypothetical protein
MGDSHANARPVCSWVRVTDPSGRTRMEARWTVAGASQSQAA